MKHQLRIFTGIIGIMFVGFAGHAQNFIKTDLGVTFLGNNKLIQSFDFNLNRTDEVQNNSGGIYFVYTPQTHFYIVPTVDANIGEAVTGANNNIVTQITFGKVLSSTRHPIGSFVNEFRTSFEINPTYNADKTFAEKLYYAQFKLYLNWISAKFTGTGAGYFSQQVISFAIDPIVNLGTHDSQTFNTQKAYSAGGVNTTLVFNINKLDSKNVPYADWVFKVSGNEYRLFSEIPALYAKDYYGQLTASIDKALTTKIAISTTYKYGNENPKYTDINSLTLGFKYKY